MCYLQLTGFSCLSLWQTIRTTTTILIAGVFCAAGGYHLPRSTDIISSTGQDILNSDMFTSVPDTGNDDVMKGTETRYFSTSHETGDVFTAEKSPALSTIEPTDKPPTRPKSIPQHQRTTKILNRATHTTEPYKDSVASQLQVTEEVTSLGKPQKTRFNSKHDHTAPYSSGTDASYPETSSFFKNETGVTYLTTKYTNSSEKDTNYSSRTPVYDNVIHKQAPVEKVLSYYQKSTHDISAHKKTSKHNESLPKSKHVALQNKINTTASTPSKSHVPNKRKRKHSNVRRRKFYNYKLLYDTIKRQGDMRRRETEFYAWIFGATMLTLGSLTTITSCFVFCFCSDRWRHRTRLRYNRSHEYQRVDSVSSMVDQVDHVTMI